MDYEGVVDMSLSEPYGAHYDRAEIKGLQDLAQICFRFCHHYFSSHSWSG